MLLSHGMDPWHFYHRIFMSRRIICLKKKSWLLLEVLPRLSPCADGTTFASSIVIVSLVNFHKKMSIQPLSRGAVKMYGLALNWNWNNGITAFQVLVRKHNLQLTAIQHLAETQQEEIIFMKDCGKHSLFTWLLLNPRHLSWTSRKRYSLLWSPWENAY